MKLEYYIWMLILFIFGNSLIVADNFYDKKGGGSKLNVTALDTFNALSQDAAIYVCRILKQSTNSKEGDIIERGRVDLEIIRTVCGSQRNSLSLPYSFAKRSVISDYFPIWPRLDAAKTNLLLCVVVPLGYDPTTERLPDGAASEVHVLTDEGDPLIEEMKSICELHKVNDPKQLKAALEKDLSSKQERKMEHALQMVLKKLAPLDADQAFVLIKNIAEKAGEPKMPALMVNHLIEVLQDMFNQAKPAEQMDKFIARCLSMLATSKIASIQENAIGSLVYCAPLARFRLVDALDNSQKTSLEKALRSIDTSGNKELASNVVLLRKWLEH